MVDRLIDYSKIRSKLIQASPEVQMVLTKTRGKRRVALMLTRMRAQKKLSQRDIAERTGWDKAFVSRLESAQGGIPDMQTLSRYADACGLSIGLLVCDTDGITDDNLSCLIVDALALPTSEEASPLSGEGSEMKEEVQPQEFDHLRGRLIHKFNRPGDEE